MAKGSLPGAKTFRQLKTSKDAKLWKKLFIEKKFPEKVAHC